MRSVALALTIVVAGAVGAAAGEVSFSLALDNIPMTPRPDPDTEARLALWNDPMGRLLYHFNQQQSWLMRGTMPGGDRASGIAVRVRAQGGLPLQVLTSVVLPGSDLATHNLEATRWPWIDDDDVSSMPLVEQISIELGRRLVPR